MKRDKKGISIMIGYVLLVTAAIVMGVIAYQWIRSYVPSEGLSCPDDVSVFVSDYWCDPNNVTLNLTFKNNGKFSIAGVFVHVANDPGIEIGSINVGSTVSRGGVSAGNAVVFLSESANSMLPGDEKTISLDMYKMGPDKVYLVTVTPARYQEVEGKLRFVNCGDAKIRERIGDPEDQFSCYFPLGCNDADVGAPNPHYVYSNCTSTINGYFEDSCDVNTLIEYSCDENLQCVPETVRCDLPPYDTSCTPSSDSCNQQQEE